MTVVNLIVGSLVGAVLWPFQSWPPLAGLTVVSLLLALGLLAVFKVASNQRALAAAKRQMQASLFELRLFEDDPRAVLRAVGDLFRQQASYLRYALVPMLWIAIPLVLLIAHLQAHYGYDGLRPGDPAVVTVRLKESAAGSTARPPLSLEAPPGVRVETGGVWTPSLREMAWRIAAEQPGDYELRIAERHVLRLGGADPSASGDERAAAPTRPLRPLDMTSVTKRLRVTPAIVARSVVRPARAVWAQLQYPAEAPLPADSPIDAIAIAYPARTIDMFGVSFPWIVIVLVLSTAFAFACRRLLGVEI